ncbi:FG-GAP-like repeat-containing protein [Flavobacterium sp. 3HN19-14]|uniref:FG-GAP-like repeat-containing protein n=1 Tax=Flavobacterium sp. 3HN19-14 TaxID=3448133 RepID=UPI003EE2A756
MKKITTILFILTVAIVSGQTSCENPISVGLNTTTTAPSFTAENGTPPSNVCGMNNGAATKGKWYKFSATVTANVTVSTILAQNSPNIDTRVVVFSGDCAALVCVTANDDFDGGTRCKVTFDATSGETYMIAFDNKYSNSGFDFSVTETPPPAPDMLSFTSQTIAGITGDYNNCVVDMNGDYMDDIVSAIDNTHLAISYQQLDGSFSTTTFTVANTTVQPSWSIAAGDYDNNGYNDLIYGSGSGVTFLKANGNGTAFTVDRKPQSYLVQRTNFVDINNDGKLDAFACDDNAPNRYYINNGTTMTHTQGGIGDFPTGGNYASTWFDYDNDGDIDMVLAKCGQGGSGVGGNIDQLFRNNGNGTYTNVAAEANMAAPEQSWSCAVGDFNNDGWMDVIEGINSISDGNTNVKRNNGDGTFTSVTAGSGYDLITSMGREFVAADFNNDGFLDVLGAGNTIMFGDGNFHFTPNPNTYAVDPYDRPIGDLNNDGFLDIQNGTSVLFNNGNENNYIKVNLEGVQSNKNGIGARLELYGAWGMQIRDVQSGTGFRNMSSITTHFGIGTALEISKLIVRWPSGAVDEIMNPAINQSLTVVENSSPLAVHNAQVGEFVIYPNPVKETINLSGNITGIETADIFDLTGRLVATKAIKNQMISAQSLSTGTYILILKDNNGKKHTQKFLKS